MEWFVWHPGRILIVACIFFLGYLLMLLHSRKFASVRCLPLLITSIVWSLYAVWEWHCAVNKYDIRIDLCLIYPVLFLITILSLFVSLISLI
jgi:hypothetical protein